MADVVAGRKPDFTGKETVEEHMTRAHPDPGVAQRERAELEARIMEMEREGKLPWQQ